LGFANPKGAGKRSLTAPGDCQAESAGKCLGFANPKGAGGDENQDFFIFGGEISL